MTSYVFNEEYLPASMEGTDDERFEQALRTTLQILYEATIDVTDDFRSNEEAFPPTTQDGVPIRKLFIGNLAERTTYKDLAALFSKYGEVESCFLRRHHGRGNYAFVTFRNVADAIKARKDGYKHEIRLHNRDLRVTPADSWHQPDNIENQYYSVIKDWEKSEKKLSDESLTQEYNDDAHIHRLNDHCLMHIFLYLPIADRVRIERVCKRWRAVSQESWYAVKQLDLLHSTWGFPPYSRRSSIDTVTLRKVLLRCGRFLNHIDFAQPYHNLSQSTLTIVAKLCPNLQTIDITALSVSTSHINSLTSTCQDITRFSLGESTYICDNDLMHFFKEKQKLEYFRVVKNNLTGKCLRYLPVNTIQEIVLVQCNNLQGYQLSAAIEQLENLRTLLISQCIGVTSEVLRTISTHCQKLKMLGLGGFFPLLSHQDMLCITQLANLEALSLHGNNIVTCEFLDALAAKCKQLFLLDICECMSINGSLSAVATLPKLEILRMNHLDRAKCEFLCNTQNLRQLRCRGCCHIQDKDVISLIKNAPNLELLDLSNCNNITSATVRSAIDSTYHRTNNKILKMYIGGTRITPGPSDKTSPFLQLVNVNFVVNVFHKIFSEDCIFK